MWAPVSTTGYVRVRVETRETRSLTLNECFDNQQDDMPYQFTPCGGLGLQCAAIVLGSSNMATGKRHHVIAESLQHFQFESLFVNPKHRSPAANNRHMSSSAPSPLSSVVLYTRLKMS